MGTLYDEDILLWSERQGLLLRRLAAGERVNDADLDWPNITEEIEAVGRSELRACESLLTQAVAHWLKQACWPDSREARHWREEEIRVRQEAADAFTPSMRQRLDIGKIRQRAVQRLPDAIDGVPRGALPDTGTLTLETLLDIG